MAISEQALYDAVHEALAAYTEGAYQNEKDTPQHMKVMGDTMKSYFEANLEVSYAWSAANPASGAPDPVTSFVSSVSFSAFDVTMPMSLPGLAAKIQVAFQGALIIHPSAWSVPPGMFTASVLSLPTSSDAQTALMNSIIRPVCAWVQTLINPVALPGSHAAFTGAAVMTKIG
jgi:hypothetical protein